MREGRVKTADDFESRCLVLNQSQMTEKAKDCCTTHDTLTPLPIDNGYAKRTIPEADAWSVLLLRHGGLSGH